MILKEMSILHSWRTYENEDIGIISRDIHSIQDAKSFGNPLLIRQVISINATVLHDNGQAVLIWSNLYVNSAVLLQ